MQRMDSMHRETVSFAVDGRSETMSYLKYGALRELLFQLIPPAELFAGLTGEAAE